jgi:CheY-like chemotaxis protein
LVVDDIEFNIIPVKMMIKENFDIDIDEASNGAIALQKYKDLFMSSCGCENRTYSLIFMDLQMPVMGGEESS